MAHSTQRSWLGQPLQPPFTRVGWGERGGHHTDSPPREAQGPGSRKQEGLRSNSRIKVLKRSTFIRLGSGQVIGAIKRADNGDTALLLGAMSEGATSGATDGALECGSHRPDEVRDGWEGCSWRGEATRPRIAGWTLGN